jgi:phosphoglycerate kinase
MKLSRTFVFISLLILGSLVFPFTSNAATLLTDDFTGTTINTAKWTEVDPGGSGGTSGSIQQNGVLTVTGSYAGSVWGTTALYSVDTFSATSLEISAVMTGAGAGQLLGYGDINFGSGGTKAYMIDIAGAAIYSIVWDNGSIPSGGINTSCGSATSGATYKLKVISGGFEVYKNDAFSVSHRSHASLVGIPKYLPSYAGYQLQKEVEQLSRVFQPKHPFLFILGGAKFETKLPLIKKFLKTADHIFIAGALANQVFKEHGFPVGQSVVEDKVFGLEALAKNKKVLLPMDLVVVSKKGKRTTTPDNIAKDEAMLDIGKESLAMMKEKINVAKFILWNGPVGKLPMGTKKILEMIAATKAVSIIGGGDTVDIVSRYKMEKDFTFVSTGGGATLDFLSTGTLPAIKALK